MSTYLMAILVNAIFAHGRRQATLNDMCLHSNKIVIQNMEDLSQIHISIAYGEAQIR